MILYHLMILTISKIYPPKRIVCDKKLLIYEKEQPQKAFAVKFVFGKGIQTQIESRNVPAGRHPNERRAMVGHLQF